jgi:hypothetical protein
MTVCPALTGEDRPESPLGVAEMRVRSSLMTDCGANLRGSGEQNRESGLEYASRHALITAKFHFK